MTDDGDPYMPLSRAEKMQREESKWQHLRKATTPTKSCRYHDRTCLTHSGEPTA